MTRFHVDKLFRPGSVAVVGASPRDDAAGGGPIDNLKGIGFDGPIYAVNPKYDEVLGYPYAQSTRTWPGMLLDETQSSGVSMRKPDGPRSGFARSSSRCSSIKRPE